MSTQQLNTTQQLNNTSTQQHNSTTTQQNNCTHQRITTTHPQNNIITERNVEQRYSDDITVVRFIKISVYKTHLYINFSCDYDGFNFIFIIPIGVVVGVKYVNLWGNQIDMTSSFPWLICHYINGWLIWMYNSVNK